MRRDGARPAVSVVVPFHGDRADAERLVVAMTVLDLRPGDELLLADNTAGAVLGGAETSGARVVDATAQRSAYLARNVAIEQAINAWVLLLDSDCRPPRDLLDHYFATEPGARSGAVAGSVVGMPEQDSTVARYSRSRRLIDQADNLANRHLPFANTANLLVRRAAWEQVGGFHERIRSAGDADFGWRLHAAGWHIEHRPGAFVEHRHRETVTGLARQFLRYGAGHAWLNRRHPGAWPAAPVPRRLLRAVAATLGHAVLRRPERARLRALDAVRITALAVGERLGNRAPGTAACGRPVRLAVLCDRFPELSETFVVNELRALERLGEVPRVEARRRAGQPCPGAGRELAVAYAEDDGWLAKLAGLLELLVRHPVRCAGDLAASRRWEREEHVPSLAALAPVVRRARRSGVTHLHAHFAAGAALSALRAGRLLGLPFSVTAHAYDIYLRPANLREKLQQAAFATSGCDYTVGHLRRVSGDAHAGRVHRIVMGVDAERFARAHPHPGGRTVLAVGRLVEKKGFDVLLDAVARLEADDPLEAVWVIGQGPLEEALRDRSVSLGLQHRVAWLGALEPDAVRARMQCADLVAVPCVVAADGDRDSMPVVAKEALALEVPVVASDEVGLPELVRPQWGRLVSPGDAGALAAGISELLSLPVAERAAMGRAGRAHVQRHCDVLEETRRLLELIEEAGVD